MDRTLRLGSPDEVPDWSDLEAPGEAIDVVTVDEPIGLLDTDPATGNARDRLGRLTGSLVALGAPRDLVAEVALGHAGAGLADGVRRFLRDLFEHQGESEVVESRLIWKPVPALMCAADEGASVRASLAGTEKKGSGWKVSLAGFGFERKRTFEVKTTLSIDADGAPARAIDLLVPLYQTIRRVVPRGGAEPLSMAFYDHVGAAGPGQIGSRSRDLDLIEFASLSVPEPGELPLGGTSRYTDERTRTSHRALAVSLAATQSGIAQEITASFETQMDVTVGVDLMPGTYALRWLATPFGASISRT